MAGLDAHAGLVVTHLLDGALFGLGLGCGTAGGAWVIGSLALRSLRRQIRRQIRKIWGI